MIWSIVASFRHRAKCLYDCWFDNDGVIYWRDPMRSTLASVDNPIDRYYFGLVAESFVEYAVANTKIQRVPIKHRQYSNIQ